MHMVVTAGAKRKKCVYCGRSFKVEDHFVNMYKDQEKAREMVKYFNSKIV
ncbi:MAG: hypothetical protein INQ03_01890 [Candidatus Heimdallarchaeota archaeon]|nr:hypothetical protein [Candidatus Heimdallarchaeota archaeon]